jgi:hypothetical protein
VSRRQRFERQLNILNEDIEQLKRELRARNDTRIQEATNDAYIWATQYTKTYNPHWVEEGRPSPYEPFPTRWPHIELTFDLLALERIHFIEKSRDMMISWVCVAYLMLNTMIVEARESIFQTQKEAKVVQLINYAKCLYNEQPQWLQDAFALAKPMKSQAANELRFAHGGGLIGIPGGADQIRSYHPWGYLLDEAAFVPDAGECYNAALSAAKGKIILNSSAGPGWFADAKNDIIRSAED